MQALDPSTVEEVPYRTPTPFHIVPGNTSVSIKGRVPGKKGKDVETLVCLLPVKARENCHLNAKFIVEACNSHVELMEIAEFVWNCRELLDDTGYGKQEGEQVGHTPEFELIIEKADRILHPTDGYDRSAPRMPRVEERYKPLNPPRPAPVETPGFIPAPVPVLAADGLPPPVADEDILQNTPRKHAIQERLK